MQQQTAAGHPTFQFGEIFGDYFVWTAWSSVTSPGSVQGAGCGVWSQARVSVVTSSE